MIKIGYRYRFYLVEKELLNKINHMTKPEFYKWGEEVGLLDGDEQELYIPLYEIGEEVFNFGDYDHALAIQKTGTPLFKDKELHDNYEHYLPHIVGKEGVLAAIETQKDIMVNYYKRLFRTEEERLEEDLDTRTQEQLYEQHIKSMYREWSNGFNEVWAINLDESEPAITDSWKFEYSIFELVRIFKATDWKKYGLIFMGW